MLPGSLKASKYSTKTIIVNQKIYKIINERKRNNSATAKLFGDLKIMNHKHKWVYIKPWFKLDMARKIAISSLFFCKYLVLWQNQSAILESIRKTIINYGNGSNFLEILDVIIKDISSIFNHGTSWQTIEYVALELIFEYLCLFFDEDKARHLLCYIMRQNAYERDPPKIFIKKSADAFKFYNITIIQESLGHHINWVNFYSVYFGVERIEVSIS